MSWFITKIMLKIFFYSDITIVKVKIKLIEEKLLIAKNYNKSFFYFIKKIYNFIKKSDILRYL